MTLFYTEDKASGSKFSDSYSLLQKKVETVASVEIQDDSQDEASGSKTFWSHTQFSPKKKLKKDVIPVENSVMESKFNCSSHLC